jgi:hypothetical protein
VNGRAVGIALGAILLLLQQGGAQAAFRPEAQFRDALARFRNLTESPTARRRPELWDQAAARFRAILAEDRAGAWADDSAYMIAEVAYERFHTFHRRADLDRALDGYRNLLLRYPRSPYGDDALVQLGEIHYYQLGDAKGALAYYRRAAREYPNGDMAPRARARVLAIETAQPAPRATVGSSEATVGERPLAKPLSSPGAVIGGRVGRAAPRRYEPEAPPAHEATAPPPPRADEESGIRPEKAPEAAIPPAREAPIRQEAPPARPAPVTRLPLPEPAPERVEPPVAAPVPERLPPPGRSRNPLLEEGPIPLKTPSDDLPLLGPRSRHATPEPESLNA